MIADIQGADLSVLHTYNYRHKRERGDSLDIDKYMYAMNYGTWSRKDTPNTKLVNTRTEWYRYTDILGSVSLNIANYHIIISH